MECLADLLFVKDFLTDKKELVVLNRQCSSWMVSKQEFILRPFFFLIYINDLKGHLTSNPKLFADDISLFSTVTDPNATAHQINTDLFNIYWWTDQWKMSFNPDPSKQAQEVIFSRKTKITSLPQLVFNNNPAHQTST